MSVAIVLKSPLVGGNFEVGGGGDGDLVFVAETHTYYLHNKALPLSVTGLVHLFVQDFDADKAISQMRRGRNWPRPQYCDARGEPLADDCIKAVGGCVKFPVQVEL